MDIKVILNKIETHKGFVYGKTRWNETATGLLVSLEPRRRSRPVCSGCGRKGPAYDRLPERRFQFVPFWGLAVFFLYAMRRVDCPRCGVKRETGG